MRVKPLAAPVAVEPPRSGEDAGDCVACNTPDDAYVWVSDRWRVRAMDRPTGLPIVLILECRSHLDLGDLPNLLAAELGVMTVRLERAIRSLDGVARVHVNRWGDGSTHLHMWFLARPYGRLQLRGTFLSLWDDILPTIPERQWRENLALVAAWLADFGGRAVAEPAHIQWQSPSTFSVSPMASAPTEYESISHTGNSGDETAVATDSTMAGASDGAGPKAGVSAVKRPAEQGRGPAGPGPLKFEGLGAEGSKADTAGTPRRPLTGDQEVVGTLADSDTARPASEERLASEGSPGPAVVPRQGGENSKPSGAGWRLRA